MYNFVLYFNSISFRTVVVGNILIPLNIIQVLNIPPVGIVPLEEDMDDVLGVNENLPDSCHFFNLSLKFHIRGEVNITIGKPDIMGAAIASRYT